MNYFRNNILFWFTLITAAGHAQDSLQTYVLDELNIYGYVSQKYTAGSIQQDFNKILSKHPTFSTSEILQQYSTIYLKSYGNNMLSTISIRGTGAGHTSLIWNGLNINSPTLGQSDLSQIPSFAYDELVIQYGGSSALYGNESIGGTILMHSTARWESKPAFSIYQNFGSYKTTNTRMELRAGNDRFESSTRFYYTYSKNDFTYNNILKPGQPKEKQKNAAVRMFGLYQDLYFKSGTSGQFNMNIWAHASDREIQPTIVNPDNSDYQEDRNIRMAVSYKNIGEWGNVNVRTGYVLDDLIYNYSLRTTSKTGMVQASYGKEISSKVEMDAGIGYKHIGVDTDNYLNMVEEKRWNGFLWVKYNPYPIWNLSFSIRKEFVPNYQIPEAPSIGSSLDIIKSTQNKITWKISGSANYRIPTLNDRFWNPGGNPDLIPETSTSLESGINWNHISSNTDISVLLSTYKMWVENWILWVPNGAIWSPDNIRKVHAQGVEITLKGENRINSFKLFWKFGYSYTKSTNKTINDAFDRSLDKQLPFVPFHNALALAGITLHSFELNINGNYTGKRFTTTDNESFLDDFWLVNLDVNQKLHLTRNTLKIGFTIKNLMNTSYFNLPFRAMPGINYSMYISMKF